MQVQLVMWLKIFVFHQIIHFLLFYECVCTLLSALQDLEAQQLLLFVQSFGIPVSSMSKLLQYLDQAVSHDPQALEQNIMDKRKIFFSSVFYLFFCFVFTFWGIFKNCLTLILLCISSVIDYMAHLVEVQHERGATGGHTFHSLLSSSLPPHRGQCLYPVKHLSKH